jgi:hypothetical protein
VTNCNLQGRVICILLFTCPHRLAVLACKPPSLVGVALPRERLLGAVKVAATVCETRPHSRIRYRSLPTLSSLR